MLYAERSVFTKDLEQVLLLTIIQGFEDAVVENKPWVAPLQMRSNNREIEGDAEQLPISEPEVCAGRVARVVEDPRASAPIVLRSCPDEELVTRLESAPFMGTPVFTMEILMLVPKEVKVKNLRQALEKLGEALNCDVDIDPA